MKRAGEQREDRAGILAILRPFFAVVHSPIKTASVTLPPVFYPIIKSAGRLITAFKIKAPTLRTKVAVLFLVIGIMALAERALFLVQCLTPRGNFW